MEESKEKIIDEEGCYLQCTGKGYQEGDPIDTSKFPQKKGKNVTIIKLLNIQGVNKSETIGSKAINRK